MTQGQCEKLLKLLLLYNRDLKLFFRLEGYSEYMRIVKINNDAVYYQLNVSECPYGMYTKNKDLHFMTFNMLFHKMTENDNSEFIIKFK